MVATDYKDLPAAEQQVAASVKEMVESHDLNTVMSAAVNAAFDSKSTDPVAFIVSLTAPLPVGHAVLRVRTSQWLTTRSLFAVRGISSWSASIARRSCIRCVCVQTMYTPLPILTPLPQLRADVTLGPDLLPALEMEVLCSVNGVPKVFGRSTAPGLQQFQQPAAPPEGEEAAEPEEGGETNPASTVSVDDIAAQINGLEALNGLDPRCQSELDALIAAQLPAASQVTVSSGLADAAAAVRSLLEFKQIEPWEHVSQMYPSEEPHAIPSFLVPMLGGGGLGAMTVDLGVHLTTHPLLATHYSTTTRSLFAHYSLLLALNIGWKVKGRPVMESVEVAKKVFEALAPVVEEKGGSLNQSTLLYSTPDAPAPDPKIKDPTAGVKFSLYYSLSIGFCRAQLTRGGFGDARGSRY